MTSAPQASRSTRRCLARLAAEICRAGWPRAWGRAARGEPGRPGAPGTPRARGTPHRGRLADRGLGAGTPRRGAWAPGAAGGVGAGDAAAGGCGRLPGESLPPAIAPLPSHGGITSK